MKPLKKGLRVFLEIAIIAVVFFAIILGVTRFTFPYVDRYHARFEQWASAAINETVTIGKIEASWKGFHPILTFSDVHVLDTNRQDILVVEKLQIGVNVLSSLLHWQIKPALLHLSGTHLVIRKLGPHTISINNIQKPFDLSHPRQAGGIHSGLTWILNQGEISVDKVDADWYGEDGKLLTLNNIQLQLHSGWLRNRLIGVGTIVDQIPSHFRFVIRVKSGFWEKGGIAARGYFYISNLNLQRWLTDRQWHGFSLTQGNIPQIRLWFKWHDNTFQEIQTQAKLQQVQLQNKDTAQSLLLNSLSANAFWQRTDTGWNFAADQLHILINKQSWPLTSFGLQHQQTPGNADSSSATAAAEPGSVNLIRADILNLEQVRNLLPIFTTLPADTTKLLTDLNPRGIIKNLLLRQENPPNQQKPVISARMDLAGIQTATKDAIPGLNNFHGLLKIAANAGELESGGENLLLHYPKIFANDLKITHYAGNLLWYQTNEGWKIRLDDLHAQDEALTLSGDAELFLPTVDEPNTAPAILNSTAIPLPSANTQSIAASLQKPLTTAATPEPYIRLLLNIDEHNPSKIHRYIPVGVMHAGLADWLQKAFPGTGAIQGKVLLQGPLKHFPFDDASGRFEIWARTQGLDFHYAKDWPLLTMLDSVLTINGRSLTIDSSHAEILNIPLRPLHAEIADLAHADVLVQGGADTNSAEGMRFIRNSPLLKILGKDIENLEPSGPMQLDLKLHIPVHGDNEKVQIDGNATLLPGNKLAMPAWDTDLLQLQGNLHFTEHSLTSDNLQAQWLGQPMDIRIYTDPNNTLKVSMQSRATVAAIEKQYGVDFNNYIQGASTINGLLQLMHGADGQRLLFTVNSNLEGISVNLPPPLKKAPTESAPSSLQLEISDKLGPSLMVVRANYASKVNSTVAFQKIKNAWSFKGGELRFGATPAAIPTASGWSITGNLPSLIWSDLEPYLAAIQQPGKKKTPAAKSNLTTINRVNLNIAQLNALGMQLNQMNIQAQPLANAWLIQLNNPMMVGQVIIPKTLAGQTIRGEFQRFTLVPGSSKVISDIDPQKIPGLNLVFHNFSYKTKSFENITLITFPGDGALQIDKLQVSGPNYNLTARGEWERTGKNQHRTTLSGNMQSGNLGAALKAWDLTGSLEKGSGSGAFAISWPGPAYDFELANMNGNFSFAFTDGEIINISQSSRAEMGLGRMLNLFSLQSLPKRLSLNFSDLTSKGFPFDTMKGDFSIRNGNALTNNAYLKGSLAKVEIKGRIGLGAKDYDLLMQLTPYVTASIPIVAGIAAGPLVGAAAFVATKVFNPVVNKITSHTYKITGPWDDPVMNKID